MIINIQRDLKVLEEYVNSSDRQTTGLLRGDDGVLRKVNFSDESNQLISLSKIISDILSNSNVSIWTQEQFRQLIHLVYKLPAKKNILTKVLLVALKQNARVLDSASTELQNDKEVALDLVRQDGNILGSISSAFKNDKEVVLAAVRQNPMALKHANKDLQNDKDVVLLAVGKNWLALEYASRAFRSDKDVMLLAVQQDGLALKYASDELKNDKDYMLKAVRLYGPAIYYASKTLNNDKDYMLAVLLLGGEGLCLASTELKNDKEVVLTAVQKNPMVLQYASKDLQNDKEVVLAAARGNWQVLHFVSAEFRNDKDVMLIVLQQDCFLLEYASDQLKNDKYFILEAVQQNGLTLLCANDKFKNDKEVVLAAIRQNGCVLHALNNEFKNDKEVVLAAVKQNARALLYASDTLQNDKEVVLAAVRQNGKVLDHVNDEFKNDKEVVLTAVKQDAMALLYASDTLQNNKEVVLAAVRQNAKVLDHVNDELRNDKVVVLAAVCQNVVDLQLVDLKTYKNQVIQLAYQIYANTFVDIENVSIQKLFEEWYPHLSNHANLPVFKKIIKIYDDFKLQNFEKRKLLINLFDLILFLKDDVIKSNSASRIIHAIFTLANPSVRRKLVEIFNQLSLKELREISSQAPEPMSNKTLFEFRTKVLLTRLNSIIGSSKFKLEILKTIYATFLKDTKIQVILFSYLEMVINLYPQLNENQRNKLILGLQTDLSKVLQLDIIQKFDMLISVEGIFGKDAMVEVCDQLPEEIKAYFAREFNNLFHGNSIILDPELSSQVTTQYQKTFAQFREPMAIFTYLKSVKQVEREVQKALSEYVYHVLKGDFNYFRNEQVADQPHLAALYQKEGVKELWLQEPQSVELTDVGNVKTLDMIQFFHQKVVLDNHFQDEDVSRPNVLKEYLEKAAQNAITDHQPYLRTLENNRVNLDQNISDYKILLVRNQLEALIIKLCAKEIGVKTFIKERDSLYRDGLIRQNEVEKALSNDFELLYQPSSESLSGAKYTLQFTTDPNDLLLLGTEVQGSCQNINGQASLNKCLLGYMINGESQTIVIKDSSKKIVGRGVVRLLLDDQGNPVLFLERLYLNKQLDSWKEAIISMAKMKAETMRVPLLSKEVGRGKSFLGTLHFKGGRAPFIYSDASGGVLNGHQAFITTGAHILFNPESAF